jgi:phage tail sheath protein FI
MSVSVTYPGVYIQELPSGVRTIVGIATSIGAFVDVFPTGPLNDPVQIFSFADFETAFGGLSPGSEASYAIQQFFLNGGSEAYVVRVTTPNPSVGTDKPATPAAIGMLTEAGAGGKLVLTATAANGATNGIPNYDPGTWGNNLRIEVDYGTTDPTTMFNLTVSEITTTGNVTTVVANETYLNLVIDPSQNNDAAATVNANSQLIALTAASGSTGLRPAQTGTASTAKTKPGTYPFGVAVGDVLVVSLTNSAGANTPIGPTTGLTTVPPDLGSLASAMQSLLQQLKYTTGANSGSYTLPNASVSVVGSASTTAYIVAESGTDAGDLLVLGGSLGTKLFATATENVQQYSLGAIADAAQSLPQIPGGTSTARMQGGDGTWDPTVPWTQWTTTTGIAQGLIGDPLQKTGIYALMDVDLFNILCIPATINLSDMDVASVATGATALCTTRRAMYLLDLPRDVPDKVPAITTWIDNNAGLRSANAALYFPRTDIPDPLNNLRLRKVGPSGTVAGLWARTDGTRGVWKAPAGTAATLTGVPQLEYKLTDPENGVLNPLGINCLRTFPIYGPVCWGARTLNGADQMADQWKYIPIRRLALYIEESLYRGTQWVVFEPNDTPLWSQIRLNVGTFMQTLFRQGAFQGSTPTQAYFVLCDSSTNPQALINQGIVNIVVGFAPLVPAEFVVISIQQMAGQLLT